jgi:hypothetical protein
MLSKIKSWLVQRIVRRGLLGLTRLVAKGIDRYGLTGEASDIFDRHNHHLLRKHYYLPLPEKADLSGDYWEQRSELVGVEMNDAGAIDLLQNVFPLYMDEFRRLFPLTKRDAPNQFYLLNESFMAVDAHVYYMFIRHFMPQRIIEIGSGNSTLLAAASARRLEEAGGEAPELVAVEPYPVPFLKEGFPGLSRLIERKVQDVDLGLFTSLGAGDILFIDSTHVLREGGDVQREYCEILPRLAPGVLVHIHDISLPKRYPRVYLEKQHYYWNEQYLLQSFLTYNSRFEVLWPGNYMALKYPEAVGEVFPELRVMREHYPSSEPSSFWMRVKP